MDCAEGYLRHCFRHVLVECAEDLAFLEEAEEKRKQVRVRVRSGLGSG